MTPSGRSRWSDHDFHNDPVGLVTALKSAAPGSRFVPVIGIVGGIGSGKSFLARALHDRHRVVVLDADAAGHEVLEEDPVKEQLRRRFGDQVINAEGKVDRRQISQLIFGTGLAQRRARAELEEIVHPRIKQRILDQICLAGERPGLQAIILDAALMLEAGWRDLCQEILFVDTPFDQRLERVRSSRGWTEEDLKSREASQLSLEEKRREADYCVDNSQGAQHAIAQLEQVFSEIVARHSG